jgi:hypothetical protein
MRTVLHPKAPRGLQTRQDDGAPDRLKTANALLDTRDAAGEHGVVSHQIVAEDAGAGSTEAPRRLTGGKTVIKLNRRM